MSGYQASRAAEEPCHILSIQGTFGPFTEFGDLKATILDITVILSDANLSEVLYNERTEVSGGGLDVQTAKTQPLEESYEYHTTTT